MTTHGLVCHPSRNAARAGADHSLPDPDAAVTANTSESPTNPAILNWRLIIFDSNLAQAVRAEPSHAFQRLQGYFSSIAQ